MSDAAATAVNGARGDRARPAVVTAPSDQADTVPPPRGLAAPPAVSTGTGARIGRLASDPDRARRGLGVLPIVVCLALCTVGLRRVLFWRDEYATRAYAELSVGQLWHATAHVDRVFLPYYLLAHLCEVLGAGNVGLRIPSVLASLITIVVVGRLAERWWGPTAGIAARWALAVNPMFIRLAVDARPYAVGVLCLLYATLALDRAGAEPHRRSLWVRYTVAMMLTALGNPLLLLGGAAQAALVLGRRPAVLLRWAVAGAAVLAVGVLDVAGTRGQSGQLDWIGRPTVRSAEHALLDQMLGQGQLGWLSWVGAALCLVASMTALAVFGRVRPRHDELRGLICAAILLLGPWLGLMVISVTVHPILISRYFAAATAGASLLLGAAAAAVQRRWHDGRWHDGRWHDGRWHDQAARTGTGRGGSSRAGHHRVTGALLALVIAGYLALVVPATLSFGLTRIRADDTAAVARALVARANPGDDVVIVQRFYEGGFAEGFALTAGDDGLHDQLRRQLVGDSHPVLLARRVTSVRPWTTAAATTERLARRVWTVSIAADRSFTSTALASLACTPSTRGGLGVRAGDAVLRAFDCPG